MRVLHISDGGLPDPRIERMALTMKKEGHELVFLGGKAIKGEHLSAFTETKTVPLGIGPAIIHDPRIKKRWLTSIEQMKPDLVHAHNVIVGHFLLDLDLPAVFDDHENLSAQTFVFMSRPFVRRIAASFLVRKFPDWERSLSQRFPVLTISKGIADYYREFTNHVAVIPNVPVLSEVEWLCSPEEREGLVYMGSDFEWPRFSPLRDMSGLRDILSFDIVTGLKHRNMMKELSKHRIGLIPYRPHPFHRVCCPNKNYEYLHAGLQVVANANFQEVHDGNPYAHPFVDYSDIRRVIDAVPCVDPPEIISFARSTYIWEKHESKIRKAYAQA